MAFRKRLPKARGESQFHQTCETNVAKETGDAVKYMVSGAKVDEDYKRYYPYGTLASKVLGFTGADNQGILGLGDMMNIFRNQGDLTLTDGNRDRECQGERLEPVNGYDLLASLDHQYSECTVSRRQKRSAQKIGGQCFRDRIEPAERQTYGDGELSGV